MPRNYRRRCAKGGARAGCAPKPDLSVYASSCDGLPLDSAWMNSSPSGNPPTANQTNGKQVGGGYFLDVGATNNNGIGLYEIALDISNSIVDDYAGDTSTTGTLTVGGSVTAELENIGDHDWFAISLEAGNTYQFDQAGPYDALLYLRDSSGNEIAY